MDALLEDLQPALKRVYGDALDGVEITPLQGDASARSYYRLQHPAAPAGTPQSLIIMRLPEDALSSDEKTDGRPRELPFLDVQRLLHSRGIPVPAVHAHDVPRRVLLLQDLGGTTMWTRLQGRDRAGRQADYEAAVDLLATMHQACAQGAATDSIAYGRGFDAKLLRWELDHFRVWGLEELCGKISAPERAALDACFDRLGQELTRLPGGFVHRDYQSKNLMWCNEGLHVIDFQDALQGPRCYDLVALLCDSYVDLDEPQQKALIDRYLAAALPEADPQAFREEFWRVAAQRKLKDAGRFVFIDRVRGNPDFLKWFPRTVRYIDRALGHVQSLSQVREILASRLGGYPDAVPTPARDTGSGASRAHL